MALQIGIFIVPDATEHERTVAQAVAADRAGLDAVAIQDHPYQRRFLDTWTLLSYVAARTERARLLPDVINLPLRLPTVIAKSAASLDLLSGGRVELGIGAGAFWEAVEAMGGPRRSPGESVEALAGRRTSSGSRCCSCRCHPTIRSTSSAGWARTSRPRRASSPGEPAAAGRPRS